MGLRFFTGTTALTGSPQPVFGTAITAAATPPPDQFSGQLGPGSNETQVSVTVTSTVGFRPGDRVAVGPNAAFNLPGLTAVSAIADQGTIKSITSSTVLVIQGLKMSHAATGEWVILNEDAGNVHIRPVVNTAAINIGMGAYVQQTLIDILPITTAGSAPGYVFDAESIGMSQPFQTVEFWVNGTAADTFLARYTQI